MEPQVGQFVKLIFRNGTLMEGIIQQWSNLKSVLKSESSDDLLVILNTEQDLLAYKIIVSYLSPREVPLRLSQLEQQFEEVYQQPSADELRLQSLAQLKTAMIQQEKKIVSNRLKQHIPTQTISKVQYGNPFNQK
jgi:sRNA-binding regulator protein Hfq